jgi:predicted amino acid-binding ACT domain protein
MEVFEIVNLVLSISASILSIIMFFLSKKEKNSCLKIKNDIDQKIQIINKKSSISSKDSFNIESVGTFHNDKSIG